MVLCSDDPLAMFLPVEGASCPLQIRGSIDTGRDCVNECHIDTHTRLEHAQLFQPFAFLQRGGWQFDKSLKGCTAKPVNANMVI